MVKETRENRGLFCTRRRRLCDNGHTFNTYEIHAKAYSSVATSRRKQIADSITQQVARYKKHLSIWIGRRVEGKSLTQLAAKFGVSRRGVQHATAHIDKDRKELNAP